MASENGADEPLRNGYTAERDNWNHMELYDVYPTEQSCKASTGQSSEVLTETESFSILDLLLFVWCIGSYLFDVGADVVLAYFYWHDGHIAWFSLTIAFVLIPSITMSFISFSWYLEDIKKSKARSSKASGDTSSSHKAFIVPHWLWVIRIVMHVLQLAPVIRYIESIGHGLRSAYYKKESRRKACYRQMAYEDADASLLRLFEAFMESAPQLVLQLYILARNAQIVRIHIMIGFQSNPVREAYIAEKLHFHPGIGKDDPFLLQSSAATVMFQAMSAITSLVSLAWALVGYQRQVRITLKDKKEMSIIGSAVYFMWRLGTVGSRVIALAVFTSVFTFWIGLVCGVHWVVMTAWLVVQQTGMYRESCIKEFLFCAALGIVYNFAYVNMKDEPTRWKFAFFYVVQFAEDTVMVILWFVFGDRFTWFYYPTLVIQVGAFWLGIAFMVLYYTNFHPNGRRSITDFCSSDTRFVPSERTGVSEREVVSGAVSSGRNASSGRMDSYGKTVSDGRVGTKGLRRLSQAYFLETYST